MRSGLNGRSLSSWSLLKLWLAGIAPVFDCTGVGPPRRENESVGKKLSAGENNQAILGGLHFGEPHWIRDLQNTAFAGWSEEDCPRLEVVPWTGAANFGTVLLSCCTSSHTCFTTKARLSLCCELLDIQHPTRICSRYRFRCTSIPCGKCTLHCGGDHKL